MPNSLHRLAGKASLDTPATVAQLDLSGVASQGDGNLQPHAATIDLKNAFYQFTIPELADWLGVEFWEDARTWKVSSVWNPDQSCYEPVGPSERLFFCFSGLPMGWTWALFSARMSCQESSQLRSLGAIVLAPL